MSDHKLEKIPTQWLDEHDDKLADNGGCDSHRDSKVQLRISQEFEIIIGTLSKESSLQPESEVNEDSRASEAEGKKSGKTFCEADRNECRLSWCFKSLSLTCADVGASRFMGKQILLCVRVGSLAALGLFAGVWLSKRKSAHMQSLLMELFVWNHGLSLLVQPFLVAGSLMALRFSVNYQEEDYDEPSRCWTAVAVSSHVVKTFSITEIIRLFTLNFVHSLQPTHGKLKTEAIFSLDSVFAAQRYVLFAVSAIEIVCCTTPQDVICIATVALISACWEVLMVAIRNPSKPLTERLLMFLVGTGVATATSALIILVSGYLKRVQGPVRLEHEENATPSDAL